MPPETLPPGPGATPSGTTLSARGTRSRNPPVTPESSGPARLVMKQTALALFQEHGFRNVSVRDITGAPGLTAAREFRDELRTWLAEHLTAEHRVPALRDPTDASGKQFQRRRAWQRVLHSGGWAGVNWPGEYGGRDASLREYAVYLLECARAGAPDPVNVIGLGMVGPTLIAHGTATQRAHLAGILSADEIWCQLFSEPDADSDLGAISTRATPRPGGGWTVNGQKVWTSWGVEGDWGLLLARTGDRGFGG